MASDAPDWERVVKLISGGSVSDAPDWQRTVTGPGAAPVGSAPWPNVVGVPNTNNSWYFGLTGTNFANINVGIGQSGYALVLCKLVVQYSTPAATDGWYIGFDPASTAGVVGPSLLYSRYPGCVTSGASETLSLVMLCSGVPDSTPFLRLVGFVTGTATAMVNPAADYEDIWVTAGG